MFKWIKNKLFHECPKKEKVNKLEKEIKLLKEELSYEEKRRGLSEWKLKLEQESRELGYNEGYM